MPGNMHCAICTIQMMAPMFTTFPCRTYRMDVVLSRLFTTWHQGREASPGFPGGYTTCLEPTECPFYLQVPPWDSFTETLTHLNQTCFPNYTPMFIISDSRISPCWHKEGHASYSKFEMHLNPLVPSYSHKLFTGSNKR